MPRPAKGPRLYWRKESRRPDGSLRSSAGWFIRDGNRIISARGEPGSGGREAGRAAAEKALADYIASKYTVPENAGTDPLIADAVILYLRDVAPNHARPEETAARLERIIDILGEKRFSEISGDTCRSYARTRGHPQAARRELEDLRAALKHWRREKAAQFIPEITLPERNPGKTVWLTRGEVARLVWAAWRMRQSWKGAQTGRETGKHVARCILAGIYTGTRPGVILNTWITPREDAPWIDIDRGVWYRRGDGERQTKKRRPPIPLPGRFLAHLRRWRRLGIIETHLIEWNGRPVSSIRKGLASAEAASGIEKHVTPHVFRHTAATWRMQNGVDLWQTAGYLGMTVEMLEERYGHHHPDHLAGARDGTHPPRRPAARPSPDDGTGQPHRNPTETPQKQTQ